jgi:hypothetical protein
MRMDANSIRAEIGFNPLGGALPDAERALADARAAFRSGADPFSGIHRATAALRTAGWLPAVLYAEALDACSPIAHIQSPLYDGALHDLAYAVGRRNLPALARSPILFERYRALRIAAEGDGVRVAYDEFALAGRTVPPAHFARVTDADLRAVRTRYETALLGALRGGADERMRESALNELEWCTSALSGDEALDLWRLANACVKILRENGMRLPDDRRLLAGFNMLLAEQAAGATFAPPALVRGAVALLWRETSVKAVAAPGQPVEHGDLLRDYGLCVGTPPAHGDSPETLWEQVAAKAEHDARVSRGMSGNALELDRTRYIGPLVVAAGAYEDFLATADASMAALSERRARRVVDSVSAAQASDAACRMATASAALGLGQVGLLADALALGWRIRARQLADTYGTTGRASSGSAASAVPMVVGSAEATDAALSIGTDALRAALHRIAAGIPPLPFDGPLAALNELIETA